MIGTRRIYDEWTAESDPAHQKYIGLILRLSCGAAIPPKQRKWPKCIQSGADLRKSEQMGVSRTYSQLPRARDVGLVTGPHARPPRTHSQWVVGPGGTPERTRGRGWESARPRTPHTQAGGAPPRAPSCHPESAQSELARVRAMGLVTGPHARTPRTHSQWVVGPGRTPERTRGRWWETARPRTPHSQARGAPPLRTLMPPPQRAKPARKSARCRVGDGSPYPQPPHPQPVGSGPRPHARTDERSGVGERPSPGRPTPRQEAPPPGHPHAAPTARKASSQERALWGW